MRPNLCCSYLCLGLPHTVAAAHLDPTHFSLRFMPIYATFDPLPWRYSSLIWTGLVLRTQRCGLPFTRYHGSAGLPFTILHTPPAGYFTPSQCPPPLALFLVYDHDCIYLAFPHDPLVVNQPAKRLHWFRSPTVGYY